VSTKRGGSKVEAFRISKERSDIHPLNLVKMGKKIQLSRELTQSYPNEERPCGKSDERPQGAREEIRVRGKVNCLGKSRVIVVLMVKL